MHKHTDFVLCILKLLSIKTTLADSEARMFLLIGLWDFFFRFRVQKYIIFFSTTQIIFRVGK